MMKNLLCSILLVSLAISTSGQSPEALRGAWKNSEDGPNQKVLIFTDGYWSLTEFNAQKKLFIGTMGGSWSLEGSNISYDHEYSTFSEVLHKQMLPSTISNTNATTLSLGSTNWSRLDDGGPGTLAGAWLITGRERNGDMGTITPGPRKTMKILSGKRFQWIAYNTETRDFLGTGGGTYTSKDGKYIENIDFFSRDGSRVGASLEFEFELKDGDWHHKGKSSKGDPIYEVWSLRAP